MDAQEEQAKSIDFVVPVLHEIRPINIKKIKLMTII